MQTHIDANLVIFTCQSKILTHSTQQLLALCMIGLWRMPYQGEVIGQFHNALVVLLRDNLVVDARIMFMFGVRLFEFIKTRIPFQFECGGNQPVLWVHRQRPLVREISMVSNHFDLVEVLLVYSDKVSSHLIAHRL